MHQGVCSHRGASTLSITQDQDEPSWDSRPGGVGGPGRRRLCPPMGARLWTWLLLGALMVPGAWSFLSEEEEELLVELHNHYRGQVSPSASAMMPLRWDPALKVVAEGYAAKCVWNHNPELEDTGENLFAGTGPLDLRVALEKWFLEHLDFDFQNNSCAEDKMCGHYTQMVWADTHRVGCAFHLCNNMEGLDWERVSFLVCNYYPAGNYEGERPFVEGDWCSRCPEKLQKCENNLCVADTEEEEDEEEMDELEEEEEEVTIIPPDGKSDPSVPQPIDKEEVVEFAPPPPSTSPPDVEPETISPSDTSSPPNLQPHHTPAAGTPQPKAPTTTTTTTTRKEEEVKREEDVVVEVVVVREEEEEELKRKKGEKAREEGKGGRDIRRNNSQIGSGDASVSSPCLLLACLTAILTLRL